jgi:Glycosyl hydrolases family 18/Secretion system C-terminal sorting domain/CUB domain
MRVFLLFALLILNSILLCSQNFIPHSIHQEQSQYFHDLALKNRAQFDSLQHFETTDFKPAQAELTHTVFGYHPYWVGSAYVNYQWSLLSDLCYFSYDVDANSGDPLTVHDWLNDAAIDSAFANNVKVHLCVTLFSAHSTFFGNADAMQNLIDQLIWYVQERGAQGVNMDFEAVPYALLPEYMDFLVDFAQQFHAAIPEGIVSIAMPAVDWSGQFDIVLLKDYIDIFMIMGYDYYWNGSSKAGPVSPLYSMTGTYNYNISRSLSYYQSKGMPREKMVLGQPYYGRLWPTDGPIAPSSTRANGSALTYANVRNNTNGNFLPENLFWEPNSFSAYYAYEANGWNQCFLEGKYGLAKRYEIVRQRELGGIGIWALGYDNGYPDLWDLIAEKFSTEATFNPFDTLFDSGGPAWDYYHNEDYTLRVRTGSPMNTRLVFSVFDLEDNYDSLWVYNGPDTNAPLLGAFSGNILPSSLVAESEFCLHFKSDVGTTLGGWKIEYFEEPYFIKQSNVDVTEFSLFPNPAQNFLNLKLNIEKEARGEFVIMDCKGQPLISKSASLQNGESTFKFNIEILSGGIYVLQMVSNGIVVASEVFEVF